MTQNVDPADIIGRTIGSYKIVSRLGQGGMASVYRAHQESIDRSVAIKIMPAELLHDPNFLKRFINEARTLARLQHPNILPLYDFGETGGLPYIIMPLMSGGTLADRIKQSAFTAAQTAYILGPIAQALDYAHSQGMLHRDIKPNNILFDSRDTPVLADFGIAKSLENPGNMTGTGIIGTPDYMSPEQARGESVDHRSDIYALAIVAYYMLAGQTPFRATTPMAILFKHVTEQPRPIRAFRPNISDAVEAIVLKSLAKDPAHRHQSAVEFINALGIATTGAAFAAPARPVSAVSPTILKPQPPAFSQTAAVNSPVTGPQAAVPVQKKGGPGLWVVLAGIAVVIGLCVLGGMGLTALGVIGVNSQAERTRTAATAIALVAQQTQQAQLATQAAVDAEATAVALSEPINRGELWPALYSDNFSSDFGTWAVGDLTGSRATGTRQITNGVYEWSVTALDGLNLRTTATNLGSQGDFYYGVDAWRTSGPDTAEYGPVFRAASDRSFYYFAISDNGYFSLYKLESGTGTILIDYTQLDSVAAGSPNRIVVVGEGSHFTFYVNGVRVAEYDDATFEAGQVGLAIQLNASENATFNFDNVEIRAP